MVRAIQISLCCVFFLSACGAIETDAPPRSKEGISLYKPIKVERPSPAKEIPYETETVAANLHVPWEIEIASDGRIFFTERPGKIRVIAEGMLIEKPVVEFKDPFLSIGEGGLLGLALDPDFDHNHYMYVYQTYVEDGRTRNRVLRLIERNNAAHIDKVLIDNIPGERTHNGGRIKIGPDGLLYITTGDAQDAPMSQNVRELGGKIIRIGLDGSVPEHNPIPGSPIYSWGHRNPQGLSWNPTSGKLFSAEHGQTAHDELNIIDAGFNYGWPWLQGDETVMPPQHAEKLGPGPLRPPILYSGNTTWAPSGMTFVTQGPWKGNLLIANLRGTQLLRVVFEEDRSSIKSIETLFKDQFGRLRTVQEGPDGSIYLLTNNRDGRSQPMKDDDKIFRLKPKFK